MFKKFKLIGIVNLELIWHYEFMEKMSDFLNFKKIIIKEEEEEEEEEEEPFGFLF